MSVQLVTFRTAGDELVCPICAPYNGRVYNVEHIPASAIPPLHRWCRCWLEYQDTDEPADTDDLDASGGGGDPSLQTYDPDDPDAGNDATLNTDAPTGVGPWEEDTDFFPDNPKGPKFT